MSIPPAVRRQIEDCGHTVQVFTRCHRADGHVGAGRGVLYVRAQLSDLLKGSNIVGFETGSFRLFVEGGRSHGPIFDLLVPDVAEAGSERADAAASATMRTHRQGKRRQAQDCGARDYQSVKCHTFQATVWVRMSDSCPGELRGTS